METFGIVQAYAIAVALVGALAVALSVLVWDRVRDGRADIEKLYEGLRNLREEVWSTFSRRDDWQVFRDELREDNRQFKDELRALFRDLKHDIKEEK